MKNRNQEKLNSRTDIEVQHSLVKRRAVLSGVSLLLVVILILAAVLAWYTRLTNVTGMTFDAAEFDINASYVSDSFIINPYDYSQIEDGLSAPGAMGYIPVRVYTSAENEVEATYSLNVDNASMAPEFEERIRFYYYTEEGGEYVEHDLGLGTEDITGILGVGVDEATEYIYWEWMYEADITPLLIAPTSTSSSATYTNFASIDEMTNTDIYNAVYYWQQNDNTEVEKYYETISAYSILDIESDSTLTSLRKGNQKSVSALTAYGETVVAAKTYPAVSSDDPDYKAKCGANIRDYIETYCMGDWDIVDTNVALGVWDESMTSINSLTYLEETITSEDGTEKTYYAYQMAMQVSLSMTGAQSEPLEDGAETPDTGTGTVQLPTTS